MGHRLTVALIAGIAAAPVSAEETRIVLRIELDPVVSERLIAMGEWITVASYYFGEPATDAVPADEMGQVYIGNEEVTIYPVSQTVIIGGGLEGAPVDWVITPRVNVNVFTARFVDEFNLINCGLVEDAISIVAGADNLITCSWLGE